MPDLVGRTLAEARTALPPDTEIETTPTEAVDRKDGTILEQQPAAGAPIPRTVRLTVARTVVPIYLDSLDPAAGEWDSDKADNGVVEMSGRQYLHSVADDVYGCSYDRPTGEVEYNLSKGYRKLVASAGLDDDARNAQMTIQLEVFADGRPVVNTAIEYGRGVPLEVDLTDVLRLRIQWQRTNQDDDTCDGATFALGTTTLFGFPEQIPTSGVPVPTGTVPGGPTRTTR